jgi:colanic acid/amylovoran biosynthesis glycosyltransferase
MFHERLRASDLFLAPSVTASNGDSEGGAPTTILDAQAVGTIIVASSHADIPFLVDDGRTGFLVEEGNANALSEGIRRALASRCEWPAIAVNAARQVAELHSDHAVAAELLRIYGKVR